MKKVEPQKAMQIANQYRLRIFQEYKSLLDGITSFQFEVDVRKVKKKLIELVERPVVYFAVQENTGFYFINYLLYHPFDWADYWIPLLKDWLNKIDSHRHDTESVCLRIDKETV